MSVTLASWQRLWGELGATVVSGGLMNQLVAAYSERQRHYHTLQHLRECLAHHDAAASLARRPAEVELALWFHDAVYDPLAADNEERSAQWAADSVLAAGCAPDVARRVHDLVMVTKRHVAPADDPDAALMLDADLAILGAAPARFDEYERQVRAEYAHIETTAFRSRRKGILEGFLARPRLYLTTPFHEALDAPARANLQRSITALATT